MPGPLASLLSPLAVSQAGPLGTWIANGPRLELKQ